MDYTQKDQKERKLEKNLKLFLVVLIMWFWVCCVYSMEEGNWAIMLL